MREGAALVLVAALHRRRILYTPVRAHRLARPHRANLAGRVVADGKDEIHLRRSGLRKFIPALAAQICDRHALGRKKLNRKRIDRSARMASSTKAAKAALAKIGEDAFGEDAARRIAGTQENISVRLNIKQVQLVGDI